jgi:YD repeat-containing protein
MKKVFPFLSLIIALVMVSCSSDDSDKVAQSSLNSITSFKINFEGLSEEDVIYDLGNNITISVPFKTDITGLVPNITISEKATISPASGESVNFVDGEAIPFTVTAENGDEKVYNVTINIRGEVGSGSKIKTYHFKDDFSESLTTYSYDEVSNFIKSYDLEEGGATTTYTLIYDDKNQVIEVKTDTKSTIYTYNDAGLIVSAVQKDDGTESFTFTYTYDAQDRLEKSERVNKENDKVVNTSYTYNEEGNVKSETIGAQKLENTYDDKNNPFKGVYPTAFAKINIGTGLDAVNINNPAQGSFSSDTPVTYTYNTDNYPLTASYVVFGFINTNVTYTYFD